MKKALVILMAVSLLLVSTGCSALQSVLELLPGFEKKEKAEKFEITFTAGEEEAAEDTAERVDVGNLLVLDQDGVRITMNAYDNSGMGKSPVLYLTVGNQTDGRLKVSCPYLALNTYYVLYANGEAEVAPGREEELVLSVFDPDLMQFFDFSVIEKISFVLSCRDANTGDFYLVTDPPVTIRIPGSRHADMVHDETGTVVCDEEGMKVVFREAWNDREGCPQPVIYMYNQRKDYMIAESTEITVNGIPVPTSFSLLVQPGCRKLTIVSVLKNYLEATGIRDAKEIGIAFRVLYREEILDEAEEDIPVKETELVTMKVKPYQPPFPETVLFDGDGVTVTAYDYVKDSTGFDEIKVRAENRSGEKKTVYADVLYLDGVCVKTGKQIAYLDAGEQDDNYIMINHDDLDRLGIKELKKVTLRISCHSSGSTEYTYGELVELRLQDGESETHLPEPAFSLGKNNGVELSLEKATMENTILLGDCVYAVLRIRNTGTKTVIVRNTSPYLKDGKKKEDSLFEVCVPAGCVALKSVNVDFYTAGKEYVLQFGTEIVDAGSGKVIGNIGAVEITFREK